MPHLVSVRIYEVRYLFDYGIEGNARGIRMSTTVAQGRAEQDSSRALYRSAPMIRGPIGGTSELVYFPVLQVLRILPSTDVRMLRVCEQFKSLAEHALDMVAAHHGTDPLAVERRLSELANEGAFISQTELLRNCAATVTHTA